MTNIEPADPFAEGRTARLDGTLLTECPYLQDTDDYVEWCAGWHSDDA